MIEYVIYVGILVSLYSIYVERKYSVKKYHPACDISKKISCTKSFTSKYGKLFGFPNSVLGLGFYFICLGLLFYSSVVYIFYLSVFAMLLTLYLIYIAYFKLKTYCVVCHLSYIVNILLLFLSYNLAF